MFDFFPVGLNCLYFCFSKLHWYCRNDFKMLFKFFFFTIKEYYFHWGRFCFEINDRFAWQKNVNLSLFQHFAISNNFYFETFFIYISFFQDFILKENFTKILDSLNWWRLITNRPKTIFYLKLYTNV